MLALALGLLTVTGTVRLWMVLAYIVAFMGSTPTGGPLVGAVGQVAGPRAALWAGAVGCLAAAALAPAATTRRSRRDRVGPSPGVRGTAV